MGKPSRLCSPKYKSVFHRTSIHVLLAICYHIVDNLQKKNTMLRLSGQQIQLVIANAAARLGALVALGWARMDLLGNLNCTSQRKTHFALFSKKQAIVSVLSVAVSKKSGAGIGTAALLFIIRSSSREPLLCLRLIGNIRFRWPPIHQRPLAMRTRCAVTSRRTW
ncbi:hypothetical protein ABBQ38_003569 [Trebouxia sp. C0009 RCD-2024]